MTTAAFICLGLTVLFAVLALAGPKQVQNSGNGLGSTTHSPLALPAGIAAIVMLLVTLVAGWLAIAPEYRLYRANVEKRIIVTQAKAEADASVEEARGEVNRAKGTAQANKIVAHSITEPYLRYLYVNNLAKTKNQVVYLPTEAGLPILEAQRSAR